MGSHGWVGRWVYEWVYDTGLGQWVFGFWVEWVGEMGNWWGFRFDACRLFVHLTEFINQLNFFFFSSSSK